MPLSTEQIVQRITEAIRMLKETDASKAMWEGSNVRITAYRMAGKMIRIDVDEKGE